MTNLRVMILVVAVLAACGRYDPAAELEAAKAELAAGDLRTASIRLSNVLQSDPDNADARLLRANLALAFGDLATVFGEIERLRALGVPEEETALIFADAATEAGQPEKAIEALNAVAASLDRSLPYWVSRAEALIMTGALDEADVAVARALSLDLEGVRTSISRGRLAAAHGDLGQAESVLLSAVAKNPRSGNAHAAVGELHIRSGRLQEGVVELTVAADLFQDTGQVAREARTLLAIIHVHLANNDMDAAAQVAERLSQRAPQAPVASYMRGLIEYRRGRFDSAAAQLQEAINAEPDNPQFLALLAAAQLAQGRLGQAEQHLLRVLSLMPNDPAATKLLAETRLRQQRPDAALDVLVPLSSGGLEDAQLGFLLGRANVLAGDLPQGVLYLEQAAALDPSNGLLKLELAKAYIATGRTVDAEVLADFGFGNDPVARDLTLRLVQLLDLARSDPEVGRREAAALVQEYPRDARAFIASAMLHRALNESREARHLLERAVDADRQSVLARQLLATALVQESRVDDAERYLREAISIEPSSTESLIGLAQLAAQRGELATAEAWLTRTLEDRSTLVPRLILTQMFISQARLAEASALLAEAAELAPDDPRVRAAQGVLALAEGRAADAVTLLQEGGGDASQNVSVVIALSEAYVRTEQIERARSTLYGALGEAPRSLPLRLAVGRVELIAGNSDRAYSLAKELQVQFPASADGYLLEGRVEVARRRYTAAVEALSTAYRQASGWYLLNELVSAQRLAGRRDEAIVEMERWLEGHENDARAALALAGLLQEAGREADALLLYEQVLRLEAENVVALNNAAWLYHETGDARALPLAVKARTVAGDNPAVLDTLGVILMAQNREEDAVAYLEMAARLAPEMPEIRYHLAQAQVATGRVTEARETLVSLVTAERPFPQRASAQELLESL